MTHPYKSLPSRAFWKRAVSANLDVESIPGSERLIGDGEIVASAGSCFAANIIPYLESAGFRYLRIAEYGTSFGKLTDDNFGYSTFSASYGNIYTARQAAELLARALDRFKPAEDRWISRDTVTDPFRPGLRYPASSEREFELLTSQHLSNVLAVFRAAQVFVFTLGLTEAWVSAIDGAVFPACPGTIRGDFDPTRHVFHNFSIAEVCADLDQFILLAREINPSLRFILTVSPVPLVATATATATESHVVSATIYSKSVLRVAAAEAAQKHADVVYFPAYEIVTGPQASHDFFETDRRQPSAIAIHKVMGAFLAHCETTLRLDATTPIDLRPAAPNTYLLSSGQAGELSKLMAEADCEEAAAGL